MPLDPVTLGILSHKFSAATDEMTLNLKRASRSVYVKEAADFGTGLVDLEGHIFAFPASTSVSAIERECGATIAAVPDLADGDVIITNDPYRSRGLATHLPDLHIVQPYFHDGRIIAYGWCFIHFMDMGGRVPASISPSNSEIFQEGLIVPPCKIVKRGRIDQEILAIIAANCRTPHQNVADIKAMLGALGTGRKRIADIIGQHGIAEFEAARQEVQDYAAAKARAVLRRIPDGVYDFWDYMDDDLVTGIPVRFRVRMTVKDGEIEVDTSGTDPQVRAAFNLPTHGFRHPWLAVRLTQFMLTYDRSLPLNYGMYRHIKAVNPPGTVLNAEFPDAVGVRHSSAHRYNDALSGAMMKACPDLMPAPTSGVIVPIVLAELDERGGRNVTVVEPLVGGRGACHGLDGTDARDNSAANLSNHPVETIEAEIGAMIRRYDVRCDSGGPGEWRGGVGQIVAIEILRDNSMLLARGMDRMRFIAWGYDGGAPSAPLRLIVNQGRPDEREYGKIDELLLKAGDTVTFLSPGGGGYGDPYRRAPEAVERDVRLGFVSREAAARDYGVVIAEDGTVDAAATAARRDRRMAATQPDGFDFGPERRAWEAVFDDATMLELNRRLGRLPKPQRQPLRRRIFDAVAPELGARARIRFADAFADTDAARRRLADAMKAILPPEAA
ncbi:MAG: hydantoinase B/oxoprolinase family protein [Alphaproteobacteria bacterium]|nr:hydantoinase B/oxoprolinase family protein [Alphaproteobacteria bacterium]